VYAQGVELLGDQRTATRATLIGATAALLGFGGAFEAAEAQFAEAFEVAEALGDGRALGRIRWGHTMSNWSCARLGEAIESGRAAIAHLRRADDLWTLVDALAWTSFPLSYGGSPVEARELAEEAAETGAKVGNLGGEFLGRRAVSLALAFEETDLELRERMARDDLERLASIRSPWVSQSHAWISTLLTLRGELDRALEHAERSIELEPESAWSGVGWVAKFGNRAMAGAPDACRQMLSERRALLPRSGELPAIGPLMALYGAAQGCVVAGLDEDAASLYPLVTEHLDRMPIGNVFDLTLGERIAGMCAAAARQWDAAERHFERALRQADDCPNRLDRPQVLHWYAVMLLDRGKAEDRARARSMLGAALDEYRRLGMPLHEAMVEARLG